MDDINYKVLELDNLQALSMKQKDQEVEEKKKLAELIERLQEDLEDQVIKEIKMRDRLALKAYKNNLLSFQPFLFYFK